MKSILAETSQAVRYGRGRPRRFERIWIDPRQIRRALIHSSNLLPEVAPHDHCPSGLVRSWRGRVVTAREFAGLEPKLRPLSHSIKLEACRRHWTEGVPWAETGVYDSFFEQIRQGRQKDECKTYEEVIERYRRLDDIFAEVKADGRLKSQMELFPELDREILGIAIDIGPGGEPIFGDAGNHRLGMALALGLPRIPAMLGFVHEDGLDRLAQYRSHRGAGVERDRKGRSVPVLQPARS